MIKRSSETLRSLQSYLQDLQDPRSEQSTQPAESKNLLRSKSAQYFVSMGLGTLYGCPLEFKAPRLLGEVCSNAKYDFAGRAIKSENRFQNLAVPDYNFSDDYRTLTIKP